MLSFGEYYHIDIDRVSYSKITMTMSHEVSGIECFMSGVPTCGTRNTGGT